MKLRSMLFPVALVLCIGLAIAPVAAAQKGPAPAGDKVNLNSATAEQLETLPGIGQKKAEAIIEGRPYARPEDIMKVKGIKQGIYDKIRHRITVR